MVGFVLLHDTRSRLLRDKKISSRLAGTTSFWTWDQIEEALRRGGNINPDEKLAGLVIEDAGIMLCLEKS